MKRSTSSSSMRRDIFASCAPIVPALQDDCWVNNANASLPPPTIYVPKKKIDSADTRLKVSTCESRRILHASDDICSRLRYTQLQLQSSTLDLLFGPDTDINSLLSATSADSEISEGSAAEAKLYDSRGRPQRVLITCRRDLDEGGGDCIEIGCRWESDGNFSIPYVVDNNGMHRGSRSATQRQYRQWYNFLTGLDLV
mmetsp:Transcript_14183/g.38742  ORF Transcript_14183/g.38742 Transcript_14183/m.38742 type:complete len:198 (-) Transcript_14183:18-611(-)